VCYQFEKRIVTVLIAELKSYNEQKLGLTSYSFITIK